MMIKHISLIILDIKTPNLEQFRGTLSALTTYFSFIPKYVRVLQSFQAERTENFEKDDLKPADAYGHIRT